jgi:vesicle-fusing ATPase
MLTVLLQVVNGPEVLSKYVGQAEENIRNLFGEAEAEYKEKGDASVSCW